MRVFIGWSRPASRQVASALRDWLKNVIQAIEPWMSEEDIETGARWNEKIAHALNEAQFGIICLTPENTDSLWIHFEAGAISKVVTEAHVCPYLFHLRPQDISGPLAQFQATPADRDGTKKLIEAINGHPKLERPLSSKELEQALEKWWPDLKNQLESVSFSAGPVGTKRSTDEILGDILENVRAIKRDSEVKDEALMADGLKFREQQAAIRVATKQFNRLSAHAAVESLAIEKAIKELRRQQGDSPS